MKASDVELLEYKVKRFRKLEKRRNELVELIEAITGEDPNGPCKQGQFTGNARESRRVKD